MEDKYFFESDGISTYFHKDLTDKDKYIVCTCAKNENDYIVEFIEHYLELGFDKIIICDNNDDDSLLGVVDKYIQNGTVEVFDCRGFGSFQVQFYSYFCKVGNYKWCAYFDCDEFLELHAYKNIKDFLDTIEEDCVSFHWINFGHNDNIHKTEGRIQDRFAKPMYPIAQFKENVFIKSIVRGGEGRWGDNTWFNGSHIPMCEGKIYNIAGDYTTDAKIHTRFEPDYKCGYLKHYYTKSFDEWLVKSQRGWPDGTPTLNASRYFLFNQNGYSPVEQYKYSLFSENFKIDTIRENYKDMFRDYSVINIIYPENGNIYACMLGLTSLMLAESGHTYVLNDKRYANAFYNQMLDVAFETGNKLVSVRNDDELWRCVELENKEGNKPTYFMLQFY